MGTVMWRGVETDAETALFLDAVAADVTLACRAANVPDFTVTPIAGCGSYQTRTNNSAGTHAGGGAVDIDAEPLTDVQARILESSSRSKGGTGYFRPRTSPTGFVYGWQRHVHILRSDCPDLSPEAKAQVADYRRGLNGLANNGPDTGNRSWVTVTWANVKHLQEDIMTPEQEAKLDKVLAAVAALDSKEAQRYVVASDRNGWNVGILKNIAAKVGVDESAIASAVLSGLQPQIRDAVSQAVAAGTPADQLADAVVSRLGQRLAQ